jgi:hypothetical protein
MCRTVIIMYSCGHEGNTVVVMPHCTRYPRCIATLDGYYYLEYACGTCRENAAEYYEYGE